MLSEDNRPLEATKIRITQTISAIRQCRVFTEPPFPWCIIAYQIAPVKYSLVAGVEHKSRGKVKVKSKIKKSWGETEVRGCRSINKRSLFENKVICGVVK